MKEQEDGILITHVEVGELCALLSMAALFCERTGESVSSAKLKNWKENFEGFEKSRKRAEELKKMFLEFYRSKMGF